MEEKGNNSNAAGLVARRLRSSEVPLPTRHNRAEVRRPWSSRARDTRSQSVIFIDDPSGPSFSSSRVQMIDLGTFPGSDSVGGNPDDLVFRHDEGDATRRDRSANVRDSIRGQISRENTSVIYDIVLEEALEVIASPSSMSRARSPLRQFVEQRRSHGVGKKDDTGQITRPLLSRIRSGPAVMGQDTEYKKLRGLLTRTLSFRRTTRASNLAGMVEIDNRSHLSTPPSTECGTIIESIECKVMEGTVHPGSRTGSHFEGDSPSGNDDASNGAARHDMPPGLSHLNPVANSAGESSDLLNVLTFIEVDVEEADGEETGFSAITGGSSYYREAVASHAISFAAGGTGCMDSGGVTSTDINSRNDLNAFLEGSTVPNDESRGSPGVPREQSKETTYEEMLATMRGMTAREVATIDKASSEMTSGKMHSLNEVLSATRNDGSAPTSTGEHNEIELTYEATKQQAATRQHMFRLNGTKYGRSSMNERKVVSCAGESEEKGTDYMAADNSRELAYKSWKRDVVFSSSVTKDTSVGVTSELLSNETVQPTNKSSVVSDHFHCSLFKNGEEENTSLKRVITIASEQSTDISEGQDNVDSSACNYLDARCQDALEVTLVLQSKSCLILSSSHGYQDFAEAGKGIKAEELGTDCEEGDECNYEREGRASLRSTEAPGGQNVDEKARPPASSGRMSRNSIENSSNEHDACISKTPSESNREDIRSRQQEKKMGFPDTLTHTLISSASAASVDPQYAIEEIRGSLAVNGESTLPALALKLQEEIRTSQANAINEIEDPAAWLRESLVDQADYSDDDEQSLNLEKKPLLVQNFLEDALVQSAHVELLGSEEWIVPDSSSNPGIVPFHYSSVMSSYTELYSAEEKKDNEHLMSGVSGAIGEPFYDKEVQSSENSRLSYNEALTWRFLHEMMSTGQTLLYLGQASTLTGPQSALIKRAVTMFIEPGSVGADGRFSFSPRLVWMSLDIESSLQSRMMSSVEFMSIRSIKQGRLGGSNGSNKSHSDPCFSIVTDEGNAHGFQAGSQHSRVLLMHGVQSVIAWLCYCLVTGDAIASSILCSDERSIGSSELLTSGQELAPKRLETLNQFAHKLLDQ